jgi:hypothetical protein
MEEINYTFAPITSYEVERSFSKYKSILVDNRQCLIIENLEQYTGWSRYNLPKKFWVIRRI